MKYTSVQYIDSKCRMTESEQCLFVNVAMTESEHHTLVNVAMRESEQCTVNECLRDRIRTIYVNIAVQNQNTTR